MFFPINRAFLYSLFLLPLSAHSISDEDFKSFKSEMRTRVDDLEREMEDNKKEIEKNQASITELSLHGQWCGYTYQWTSDMSVISYDRMSFENSNMNSNALNIGTGETLIKTTHLIIIINASASIKLKQILTFFVTNSFEYLAQIISK